MDKFYNKLNEKLGYKVVYIVRVYFVKCGVFIRIFVYVYVRVFVFVYT